MNAEVPLLRVVRGEPTPEELGALVAAVTSYAVAGVQAATTPRVLSAWVDRHSALRRPLQVRPGAWVASGLRPGARTRAGW